MRPKPPAGQAPRQFQRRRPKKRRHGLLVNGSVNNAATSQFTLAQRFGNTASGKSLYNFMINLRVDNSALDARSYSLAGMNTREAGDEPITGGFALQGPLKIPGVFRNGPNISSGIRGRRTASP